jgi:hypothetical protein
MRPLALKGPIVLTISKDRVELRADEALFVYRPVIYFEATPENPRVLGIGDDRVPAPPSVRVDLFKPGGRLPLGVSKPIALDRFFRYLMKLVVDRYLFRVKPDIEVVGAESLEPILAGYQEQILEKALEGAGARNLTFRRQDQLVSR